MNNNNTCNTYYQKITTTATKNKNKGVLEEARNRGKEKGGKEKAK